MKKKLLALGLAALMLVGASACGGKDGGNGLSGVVDNVAKAVTAQGRTYNNLHTMEIGETKANTFFEWTVNSVRVADVIGDFEPTEGMKFVIADMTVTNIFDDEIPVGNYDYIIVWGEDAADEDYAYDYFYETMMPDEVYIANGESLTGEVVFEVPADVESVSIIYDEVYEDDFVGDTYTVDVDLTA